MDINTADNDSHSKPSVGTYREWGEDAPETVRRGRRAERQVDRTAWGQTDSSYEVRFKFPSHIPAWVLVALIGALVILPTIGRWCALAPDSIAYLSTARTLFETGALPHRFMMRPPGFPVLLAPLFMIDGLPLLAIRVLLAACFIAAGTLTTVLFSRELGRRGSIIAGLLVVTNCVLIIQSTVALSEMVFIPLQLGAFILLDAARHAPRLRKTPCALAGLLAAAAILTRSLGILLIPVGAAMIYFSRNESSRNKFLAAGVYAAIAISVPAAWQVRQSAYPSGHGYGQMWTHALQAEGTQAIGLALQVERLEKFGPMRLDGIKAAMVPNRLGWRTFQSSWARTATWIVGFAFIAIALSRLILARSGPDAYLLATLGALALWPWDEGVRLIVPLIPFFVGGLVWVAVQVHRRQPRWIGQMAIAAIGLILLGQFVEVGLVFNRLPLTAQKAVTTLASMREFAATLNQVVPEDAPILCVTPNGHNAKLTFAGGALIARQPAVNYLDVIDGLPPSPQLDSRTYVIVENSLSTFEIAKTWGISPVFRCRDYSVYSPTKLAKQ